MRGLDFTAIDFETANSARASACSVGLARVVDGQVVETASWLIHPPAEHDTFLPRNIKVHGITAAQVAGSPYWGDVLPEVMAFKGQSLFVAHNAAFDRGVFQAVTTASGLAVPDVEFRCSLKLAQNRLELPNHKLPTVAGELGVPLLNHHDACADAEACAHVVLEIARRQQQTSLAELWPPAAPYRRSATASHAPSKRLSELAQANQDADPTNPMYGQVVVFTGEMVSMERDAAMNAVASHGGSNGNNITKKTTILVAATTGTGKERKAQDYIGGGQAIRIISEREFLAMLDLAQKPAALRPATRPTQAAVHAPAPSNATREREAPTAIPNQPTAVSRPVQPKFDPAPRLRPAPAQVAARSRTTAKAKRGTVLTADMRRRTPKAHRIAGAVVLAASIVVGLMLAAIPVAGAFLCLGTVWFGIYTNIVRRRIARSLEREAGAGQWTIPPRVRP